MATVASLALLAVILIVTVRITTPFWKRIVESRKNPPNTGLEVIYPLEPSTKDHETTLDEPDASNFKFDLVAVHGLGAYPTRTWTKRRGDKEGKYSSQDDDRVDWLKDFVPRKFPKARVMRFAHNADWFYRAPQKTSAESGRELLADLKEKRKSVKGFSPIIIIGHSFGGIIVKDALITAKLQAPEDPGAMEILKATCGIIFLGTPHQGSELSIMATWLAVLTAPLLGSNPSLPRSLTHHSADLDDKHSNFCLSYVDDTWVHSFYESLNTEVYWLNVGKIVDRSSASAGGRNSTSDNMNKDHSGLSKFNKIDDPGLVKIFRTTREQLEHSKKSLYFKESRQHAILSASRHFLNTEESSILATAEFSKHKQHLNNLSLPSIAQQTKEWFLSGQEYDDWSSPDATTSQFLWFRGKPNIGKSITCASMVDHLQETLSFSKEQDVLFFFCFVRCTQVNIITSLLAQLVEQDQQRIHALTEKDQDLLLAAFKPGCNLQAKDLWDLFKLVIRVECRRDVIIIIDGIDAIDPEPERKSFAIKLRDFYQAFESGKSLKVRCLVTSRRFQPIVDVLKSLRTADPASEMSDCLQLLLPSAQNTRQKTVSVAEESTGHWIFNHDEFKDWLKAENSSTLWLSGKPGSGKSTLIREVLSIFQQKLKSPSLFEMLGETQDEDVLTDRRLNLEFGVEKKAIVASFFYNARSQRTDIETSHTHMLQSMLFQLLTQEEDLFPLFRQRYIELKQKINAKTSDSQVTQIPQQWPFYMLLGILGDIIRLKPRSCVLYIFVDAMDESENSSRDVILSLLTDQDAFQVKTMIASRPIKDPKNKIGHKIILEAWNKTDITRIVETKIASWMEAVGSNNIVNYRFGEFQTKLEEKADGVILWVSLVLAVLHTRFDANALPAPDTLMETLERLPSELEDLYVAIVNRLKETDTPTDIPKGKQWLEWAAFSARYLDLNEFLDAIAVSELDVQYDGTVEVLKPKQFPSDFKAADGNLRRLCGGFVELKNLRGPTVLFQSIQPDDLAVQLLHQTVKHFLGTKKAGPFTCLKQEGDSLIAKTCSRYLLSLSGQDFLPSLRMKPTTTWKEEDYKSLINDLHKRPLLVYVFTCLPYHLTSEKDLEYLGEIIERVRVDQPALYLISSWATHVLLYEDQKRAQTLDLEKWRQFWSRFSTKHLSTEEEQFLPKFKNMAIVEAVREDRLKAVKILLAVGAIVDDNTSTGMSALKAAAKEQRFDMQTYLSEFANPRTVIEESKATDMDSEAPSDSAAIHPPHQRVDSFPFQNQIQFSDALHEAASTGNISRLRRLLDAGADPDRRQINDGLSPIHLATMNDHVEAIKVLLEAGGDPNSADKAGVTPLMLAGSNGSTAAATLLLQYKADLNATSNKGDTAYSLAQSNNQRRIMWFFDNFQKHLDPGSVISKVIFMVPYSRNRRFVGRESYLNGMNRLLHSDHMQAVALAGLSGIGKTELALEYVYQESERYPETNVFWLYAGSMPRAEESGRRILDAMNVSYHGGLDVDILDLAFMWLSKSENRWILVIDNMNEPEFLDHYFKLNSGSGCQVIITTQNQSLAIRITEESNVIILDSPTEREMVALMVAQLGDDQDEEQLFELARLLDCLPLAVTQATSYLALRRMPVSRYLELYKQSESNQISLLNRRAGSYGRYRETADSVLSTLELSVERVRIENEQAFELLANMSVFDTQGIPDYLVNLDFDDNALGFEQAVHILLSYSLITKSSYEATSFNMHRLVQAATRHHLQISGDLTRAMGRSVERMNLVFPIPRPEEWEICASLLPHAKTVLQHGLQDPRYQTLRAEILLKVGEYLYSRGHYASAEVDLRGAVSINHIILGPEHHSTLSCMSLLGLVLSDNGKYDEAEKIALRVLRQQEHVLGIEHPDTVASLSNLARVLVMKGNYEEATNLFREALITQEKLLGSEHPSTLDSMSGLASALRIIGRLEEAGEMYRSVLALKDRVLGPEHPSTLESMTGLASTLKKLGKFSEAMHTYRSALELKSKVLGPEHPSTLRSMTGLASTLRLIGDVDEAMGIYRTTLELQEKVLGPEHPSTLQAAAELGSLYEDMNNLDDAETMYLRALSGKEEVFGLQHPSTQLTVKKLASLYRKQSRHSEARKVEKKISSS